MSSFDKLIEKYEEANEMLTEIESISTKEYLGVISKQLSLLIEIEITKMMRNG